MENIGVILKERRLELGYTLEEMSAKTKLSTIQLEAIEAGNIQFFKEDLSYLSYFVRYYANALDVNYDEIRRDLDETIAEYTNSVSLSQIQKQEEINSNVKKNASKSKSSSQGLTHAKKSKKFDLSSIGLLALALVVLVTLGFVFVNYIIPSFSNADDPIKKPDITVNPGGENPGEGSGSEGENGGNKPVEPEKPQTPTLTITKIDATTYEIKDWVENADMSFDFKFNSKSWMSFFEDGKAMPSPKEGIYESGSTAKAIVKATANKTFDVNFGFLKGNEIEINGNKVEIDASIANSDVAKLTFKFIGGKTN